MVITGVLYTPSSGRLIPVSATSVSSTPLNSTSPFASNLKIWYCVPVSFGNFVSDKYTSPERDQTGKYAANCVLMGNISEKKDAQGNIVFNGEIKNIGGRRADFVKVDFVFRKNWSGETKTLTTFIRGGYHTFDSGITTDATLLPGATGAFELYVPHDFGSFIGYSYVIDWEEYE